MIVHEGHTDQVWSVAFSADGKSVVSGSDDGTVRVWNTHKSSPIGEPLRGHRGSVFSVSYSPLGNLIASASGDIIRLWDPSTRQQSGDDLESKSVFSVAFSPDAKFIASGCGKGYSNVAAYTIQLWDVQTRKLASEPFKGHTTDVESVSFSPDGARIVSGSYDNTIRIWDIERGVTIGRPLEGHTDWVRSAIFSLDSAQIVSCSDDCTIRFWDARTGETIGEPYTGHTAEVRSIAFSPRGTYMASGSCDHTIRLWDVRTGRQVDPSFGEHTDAVYSLAYSPCGQYIASASANCQVIIRGVLQSGGDPDPVDAGPRFTPSEMSTQQMFQALRNAGCVDLTPHIDFRHETLINAPGGGYGDMWQSRLNGCTKVSIKAWRSNTLEQSDHTTLTRVAQELSDLSKMGHPNVHRLQGVIMFRDHYLGMVSEWMDNGNLHDYLMKHPDADRYRLCAQVASGLDHMHFCGKVHGDLKAVNVLVSSDGTAKLSHLDSSAMSEVKGLMFLANSNSWSGTFRWMAPEILSEEVQRKTPQTDVYALGMTMLEIFTGQPPYPDYRSDISVIKAIERGTTPARPTKLENNQKDDNMWQLLVRCWSRTPNDRPSAGFIAGVLQYMS
ncbi:unnamed protein product [Rhizoctonia solani]|uniref:Protein kinase domain-containing protein n=1 Tax=Rhizoctonia solani TaxID=456999 RepID=A0A8H3HQ96_9AGAM|nr:unnamed protein product [Rhizoctonia solani]